MSIIVLLVQSVYYIEIRVSFDSKIISTYLLKWPVRRWGKCQGFLYLARCNVVTSMTCYNILVVYVTNSQVHNIYVTTYIAENHK